LASLSILERKKDRIALLIGHVGNEHSDSWHNPAVLKPFSTCSSNRKSRSMRINSDDFQFGILDHVLSPERELILPIDRAGIILHVRSIDTAQNPILSQSFSPK